MKKKFSQGSSTTQRDAKRERVREMGDDFIRQDIQQLIRDVAEPRDAEIARLRAKVAAWRTEIRQLRALALKITSTSYNCSTRSQPRYLPNPKPFSRLLPS